VCHPGSITKTTATVKVLPGRTVVVSLNKEELTGGGNMGTLSKSCI